MKQRTMIAGLIYRTKRKSVYYSRKYPCAIPADYANGCLVGDCFVCDENGKINKDLLCPVPMPIENLGEIIGKADIS